MQPENVFRPGPTSKSEFVTTQSREIKFRIPYIFSTHFFLAKDYVSMYDHVPQKQLLYLKIYRT